MAAATMRWAALSAGIGLSCSCGQSGGGDRAAFDSTLATRLQTALAEKAQSSPVLGVSAAVRDPQGFTWSSAVGAARLPDLTPVQAANRGKIGSVSKTFSSTVVLQLVDEGRLSLDDTLGAHQAYLASQGVALPEAWKPITLRQLLYHAGGLDNYVKVESFVLTVASDPLRRAAPAELVNQVIDRPLLFPPGTGWAYSNTGYVLLAMIAEEVTASAFGDLVNARIVDRLGLQHTRFPAATHLDPPFSDGYLDGWADMNNNGQWGDPEDSNGELDPEETTTYLHPSVSWSAGAMISSAEDLLRWSQALVSGELLSPAMQAQRMTFIPAVAGIEFGIGVVRQSGFLGHQGQIYGYEAVIQSKDGWHFAVLVNGTKTSHESVTSLFEALAQVVFGSAQSSLHAGPRLLLRQPSSERPGAALDEYPGIVRLAAPIR